MKNIAKAFGYMFLPNAAPGDNHLEGGLAIFSDTLAEALVTPDGVRDPRRAQYVRIKRKRGRALRLLNVYLPLQAREAGRQLDAAIQGLAGYGGDRIIIGDFNLVPQENAIQRYLISGALKCGDPEESWNEPTRKEPPDSGRKPRHVDYLMHSKGVRIMDYATTDVTDSDHLARIYEVEAALDDGDGKFVWPRAPTINPQGVTTDVDWQCWKDANGSRWRDFLKLKDEGNFPEAWCAFSSLTEAMFAKTARCR